MIAAIRRCQGEDQGSRTSVDQVQTKHQYNSGRRRPWGDGATQRVDQACSPFPRLVRLVNNPRSALEEIERQSQALLAKGAVARFVDKAEDSNEVVKLIERLQEAITHYQVSGDGTIMPTTIDMKDRFRNSKPSTIKSPISP